LHNVPTAGNNLLTRFILKIFAPADLCLGVHWHHFDNAILPPLIEPPEYKISIEPKKILVYLPFDDIEEVVRWLAKFPDYTFHIYCEYKQAKTLGHLLLHPYSRENFQRDLASCSGVISNAGFGLSSEALQYGKKILVKPLQGQMEQLSNAQALLQLNLGEVIHAYDEEKLKLWLEKPNAEPVEYPNVADAIVNWLENGRSQGPSQLAKDLWKKVGYHKTCPN